MCLNKTANLQETEETGFGNTERVGKVSEAGKDPGYLQNIFAGGKTLMVPLSESVVHLSS